MRISDWSSDVCSSDLVEDEAAAVVALAADLFEVAKDAAVELQHVAHAVRAQPQRGLFAADAARAEAHHGGVGQRLAMRRQGLGQLGERSEEHTYELPSLMRISYGVF